MGHGEGVVVEVELEEVKKNFGLFEASTLVRGCPIGNTEVDMDGKEG